MGLANPFLPLRPVILDLVLKARTDWDVTWAQMHILRP